MHQSLTIFTPTFNRGYILPQLYDSLINQSCRDFTWLIINDGSTDHTSQLVKEWINEGKLEIEYFEIKNGGKPRAINMAIDLVNSDYIFIVDSDDHLINEAVSDIYQWIEETKEIHYLAGFAGLKGLLDGNPIHGKPLIDSTKRFVDAYNTDRAKYNLVADMAEVYKLSVLKNYRIRVHPDEKYTPLGYIWNAIAMDGYKIRWYNKVIYLCEYLADGYTCNGRKTAKNSPTSRAFLYLMYLNKRPPFLRSIYYTLYAIGFLAFKNDFSYLKEHPNKLICLLCFPMGYILGKWKKYQWRNV